MPHTEEFASLLDVACGTGRHLAHFSQELECWGTDIDEGLLAIARDRCPTVHFEVADMVERFETRKLVDRAKGLLNEKMGLSEPEAFRWIQKTSMDRRLSMREVAETIINQVN